MVVKIFDWRSMKMASLSPSKVKFIPYSIRILDFNGAFVITIKYSDLKLQPSWFKCFKSAAPFMRGSTILYTRGWLLYCYEFLIAIKLCF
jgi:hypothetical protein